MVIGSVKGKIYWLQFIKDGFLYTFQIAQFDNDPTTSEADKFVDQIIETFKFIEPVDTSDWQTYRNEEYGFEVKYPGEWYSYVSDPVNVYFQPYEEMAGSVPGPHADALEIRVSPISPSATLLQAIQKENSIDGEAIDFSQENIKIGGVDGLKVKTICEGVGCGAPQWFIIKNNHLYYFNSNLGYTSVFDQILSTFKFIEPATTIDSFSYPSEDKGWLIYHNNNYGYELKYPKEWVIQENYYWHDVIGGYVKNITFTSPDGRYFLLFGIKNKESDISLSGRTGTGAGEFKEGDNSKIDNVDIITTNLVFEGKIKEVYYTDMVPPYSYPSMWPEVNSFIILAEFSYGDISLDEFENLDMKNLLELKIANQILSTFKFIEPGVYKNEEFGFEVKYPLGWEAESRPTQSDKCNGTSFTFYLMGYTDAYPGGPYRIQDLNIDICPVISPETAEAAFARIQGFSFPLDEYRAADRQIAGMKALSYDNVPAHIPYTATFFIKDNKIYIFSSVSEAAIYNNFIASFKFID